MTLAQLDQVANKTFQGLSLQEHAEQEIVKQGNKNYKLLGPFWDKMFAGFKLNTKTLQNLPVPSGGTIPEAMLEALKQCKSDNHCVRGAGMKMLKAVFTSGQSLSNTAIYGCAKRIWDMSSTSRSFQDKLKWEMLNYVAGHSDL